MASPGLLGFLVSLLLGLITCDPQPPNKEVFGAMHQNVTFTIKPESIINHVPFKDILWKKGKDKLIEWDELHSELKSYPPFINRSYLNTSSGELTISNLTSSDEDEYEVESTSIKDHAKFTLKVIEPLPPLTLNCTLSDKDVVLRCELGAPYHTHEDLVSFTWQCPAAQCKNTTAQELHFNRSDVRGKVMCVAENKLFRMHSSVDTSACFPVIYHLRHRWFLLLSMMCFIGTTACLYKIILKGSFSLSSGSS